MSLQETVRSLRRRLADLFFEDTGNLTRFRRTVLYLLRLVVHIVRQLREDQAPLRTAALAYTTVLSLVPCLALFVLYFKLVGKLESAGSNLQDWIVRLLVADAARDVINYIDRFIENIHTRTIGSLGVLGLLLSAYILFQAVEKTFNDIWHSRRGRSIWIRFQSLSAVLILVPGFVMASLYVSGKFQGMKLQGAAEITSWMQTVFVTAPFLLTIPPLFFLFKLVPTTHVRNRPALIAAVVSSLLLEFGKMGFNYYVLNVISASKIYGSLGLFPVFLIWIYLSWLIILFGAEVAYTIQNLKTLHEEHLREHYRDPLGIALHEDWALAILRKLLKHFHGGRGPATPSVLAGELDITEGHVVDHLKVLEEEGLIVETSTSAERGFVPNRPPTELTVRAVRSAIRSRLGLPTEADPRDGQPLFVP